MKGVVEVDRRTAEVRASDERLRDQPAITRAPALDSIADAVSALEERQRIWERGFEAGIRAGSQLARGTRDDLAAPDEEPTAPYPILDALE